MKRYTVEQLENPQTYQNDPKLAEFAHSFAGSIRQVIYQEYGYDVEGADVVMSGVYAERVHKSWTKRCDKLAIQVGENITAFQQAQGVVSKLQRPDGVTVELTEDAIYIYIPRDGGLMTPKIKRLGGEWDNENKRFWLPLDAAKSLPRILKNWERDYSKKSAEIAQRKRAEAERRERESEEQRVQWDREREEQRAQWAQAERERLAQAAHAKANRTKIVVGKYQIGDMVKWGPYETREIKSFGQSWTANETMVPNKYWHGTLYQECAQRGCDREPVELESEMCERHHPESVEIETEYCYAYFI